MAYRKGLHKLTIREIKASKGRFFAILAITALGVAFFSGIKITTPDMIRSVDDYYNESEFYDIRLVSTLGWERTSPEILEEKEGVRYAEGACEADVMYTTGDEDRVFAVHSITENVNKLTVTEGRLPEKTGECVIDDKMLSDLNIGDTMILSPDNEEDTKDILESGSLLIVGKVNSPLYINFNRGTTSIGNGTISGFIFVPEEEFDTDYYTEIYLKSDEYYKIYSDEYKAFIKKEKEAYKETAKSEALKRYGSIRDEALSEIEKGEKEFSEGKSKGEQELADAKKELDDALSEIEAGERRLNNADAELRSAEAGLNELLDMINMLPDDSGERALLEAQYISGLAEYEAGKAEYETGVRELAEGRAEYEIGLSEYEDGRAEFEEEIARGEKELAEAREELDSLEEPEVYLLGRDTNISYISFESDSGIVEQLAKVFPVFFILVASMICMTTMGRMVEEGRLNIGTLKALGYGKTSIMGIFMTYSGLAAVIGWVVGYVIGITVFPATIWTAYSLMYISMKLRFMVDIPLAVGVFGVTMICILGTTYLTCRYELHESAASLMRPKAPKAGKRILIEHIGFIWKHLGFMRKISIRNIFRYKQRLFMMTLGIGGCMALLLTGYGIRDSIADFADIQYGEVVTADGVVTYKADKNGEIPLRLRESLEEKDISYSKINESTWDLNTSDGRIKSITLMGIPDTEEFYDYFRIEDYKSGAPLETPEKGEAYICVSLMERMDIKPGDMITLTNEDMDGIDVKVSGVFTNYVYNYVIVSDETLGDKGEDNTLYISLKDQDNKDKTIASLSKINGVRSVMPFNELKAQMSDMMKTLNYVVLLVIIFAAGLSFVVVYNLTNINITERLREIATIKVLGFYRRETYAYVLRENILLTAAGSAAGIVMGYFLLKYVIHEIKVDMVYFDDRILLTSYVAAVILTFVFTIMVNMYMRRKLDGVNMAESLKSVE